MNWVTMLLSDTLLARRCLTLVTCVSRDPRTMRRTLLVAPFFGIFLEGHERPCQLQLKSFPRWPFSCPQHHGQGWWSCTGYHICCSFAAALCLMGKCTMPHSIGKSKEDHGRVLRYVHKHYTKACLSVYHLTGLLILNLGSLDSVRISGCYK